MITVNLLERAGSGTGTRRRRSPFAPGIGLAFLLVAALGSSAAWWSAREAVARVDREMALIDANAARLRVAAREAEQTLARKTTLAERVRTIDQEHRTRFAPVRVLETVGRSLPADVWLTSIQQRGTRLEIDGRARSLDDITEFAGRIQHAGVVTTPVEVVSTSTETRDGQTVVRFALRVD